MFCIFAGSKSTQSMYKIINSLGYYKYFTKYLFAKKPFINFEETLSLTSQKKNFPIFTFHTFDTPLFTPSNDKIDQSAVFLPHLLDKVLVFLKASFFLRTRKEVVFFSHRKSRWLIYVKKEVLCFSVVK